MKNSEAIKLLEYLRGCYTREGGIMCQAVDMAIEALKPAPVRTNADHIRQITDDEELLSAIGTGCYRCTYNNGECDSGYGEGCITGNLEWLKQEVSEYAGTD